MHYIVCKSLHTNGIVISAVDPSDLWFLESVTPTMTASQVPTVVTMDPVTSVSDTPYPAQTTVCINDSDAVDGSGSVPVDNGEYRPPNTSL